MADLEKLFGVKQREQPPSPSEIRGILQTKNYESFSILRDVGDVIHTFDGAKLANKCMPGDHVYWDGMHCQLELRDEYPLIVGTIELTSKSRYGLTNRNIPMYLFTPYDKKYPQFIVGCSEKDKTRNIIGLIKFSDWQSSSMFPRGHIQQILGISGDKDAEYEALIWQSCPYRYPKFDYTSTIQPLVVERTRLSGFTFNIDPQGCKDVDDVFTFEKVEDSKWKVTITISDVALYVSDGSAIDIMASLIGQTLYDRDGKVIRPMLPAEYSEQACSLLPNKDSFGISLQFIWDGTKINHITWMLSIVHTNKSYTYEEFQMCDLPCRQVLQEIACYLAKENKDDSHEWVEQMMIFYNTEAGKILKDKKVGILRRHSVPNQERLERYRTHLPEWEKLAFSSAEYCLAEESNTQHYGLLSDTYAHTSSPIRRYADLVNQRILHLYITKSKEDYIVPQVMYDMNCREKAIRRFARDVDFLDAISSGNNTFEAIIMEKKRLENEFVKIKLYVPEWKRLVSTTYKYISENVVLSRDEKTELMVDDYKKVKIQCAYNHLMRNWKDRIIINLSNFD